MQWDPQGYWCTIQLDFVYPLVISLGEKVDEIEIKLHKEYFLREWTPPKNEEECRNSYKCRDKQDATLVDNAARRLQNTTDTAESEQDIEDNE